MALRIRKPTNRIVNGNLSIVLHSLPRQLFRENFILRRSISPFQLSFLATWPTVEERTGRGEDEGPSMQTNTEEKEDKTLNGSHRLHLWDTLPIIPVRDWVALRGIKTASRKSCNALTDYLMGHTDV
jgi:hypothetical protein